MRRKHFIHDSNSMEIREITFFTGAVLLDNWTIGVDCSTLVSLDPSTCGRIATIIINNAGNSIFFSNRNINVEQR